MERIPASERTREKLRTLIEGRSEAADEFLSKPIIAEPGSACTETYLVAGHFDDEKEAINCAQYLRTRFVRFLVSLRKVTQHAMTAFLV